MLGPVFAASYLMNTAVASDMAFRGQTTNQAIQDLAFGATPADGNPASAARLQRMEKALMFQGIQAQTNYLVSQARLDGLSQQRRMQADLDKRLMDAGAIFV